MTDSLPPQANLFGFHDVDPRIVDQVERALRGGGEFTEVWRPAEGWVAASMPLPHGPTDDEEIRRRGLAFAHGGDVVGSLDRVVKLAEEAPERLSEIRGDFGFVYFRDHGNATIARAASGLAPFYVRATPTRIAIATLIGDIVRYDPTEPQLDEFVTAAWTTGYGVFPYDRTFVVDVKILRPGHARVVGEGARIVRWWDPRPERLAPPNEAAHRERAAQLRELLLDTLRRELSDETGNVLTLSGGVDSSALGVVAAGVLGKPVWSVSRVPPEGHPRRTYELSYIDPLIEQYKFARSWQFTSSADAGMEAVPRGIVPLHGTLRFVRDNVTEFGPRVLFGGHYADEVCGSKYTLVDWAMHVTLRTVLPLPTGMRDLGRIAKWRTRWAFEKPDLRYPESLPGFWPPDLGKQWREWLAAERRIASRDRGVWPYRWAWRRHDGWLASHWEALTALGIRVVFPFAVREVQELAYASHPVEIAGPGTKRLLKQALGGDVPTRWLDRPDKGDWGGFAHGPDDSALDRRIVISLAISESLVLRRALARFTHAEDLDEEGL